MDRIGKMAAFVKVVETGSFVGAAGQLRLSPTMISRHVRQLEERLGVTLLHRTTRRVGLTEVGALFYERCAALLAELDELEGDASRLHATPRGRLRVSAPLAFGSVQVAAVLADFAGLYPDVAVELVLADRGVDLVEEGFDLAVVMGELPVSSYMTRLLLAAGTVLCAAPDYLARRGGPLCPEDLAGHNCLTHSDPAHAKSWTFVGPDRRQHQVRISGGFHSNSITALVTAALQGLGLVLAPVYLVGEHLRSGALVAQLEHYATAEVPIRLVYPPGRPLSAKVRSFIDFLVERLSGDAAPPAQR